MKQNNLSFQLPTLIQSSLIKIFHSSTESSLISSKGVSCGEYHTMTHRKCTCNCMQVPNLPVSALNSPQQLVNRCLVSVLFIQYFAMVRRAAAAYLVIHLFAIAWAHSSPWLNESTSAVESSFAFQDVDPQEEIINWTIESSGSSPVSALDPGSADKFRVKRASVASTTTPATTTTMIASSTTTKKPTILLVKDFETFKKTYKKSYKRRFREYRSKIAFDQNRDLVVEQEKQFKQGRSSFRCSTNVMSDLSQIEYLMRYVRMTSNHYNSLLDGEHLVSAPMVDSKDIPEELDWRKSGFVTPPDNQKSCGSCYAFSIARSIEGWILRIK